MRCDRRCDNLICSFFATNSKKFRLKAIQGSRAFSLETEFRHIKSENKKCFNSFVLFSPQINQIKLLFGSTNNKKTFFNKIEFIRDEKQH